MSDPRPEVLVAHEGRLDPGQARTSEQLPDVAGVEPDPENGIHRDALPLCDTVEHRVETSGARSRQHIELDPVVASRLQGCRVDPRAIADQRAAGIGGIGEQVPTQVGAVTKDPDAAQNVEFGDRAADPDREAHAAFHGERDAQAPSERLPAREVGLGAAGVRRVEVDPEFVAHPRPRLRRWCPWSRP